MIDTAIHPADFDSLIEFVAWYKASNYPVSVPANGKIFVTDVSTSTVVFRRGRFQVELYFAHPSSIVKPHSHDMDLVIIYLGGGMQAIAGHGQRYFGAQLLTPDVYMPHPEANTVSAVLPAGVEHSFITSKDGCIFYNIQQWCTDDELSSATINYRGQPLGPKHERSLGAVPQYINPRAT